MALGTVKRPPRLVCSAQCGKACWQSACPSEEERRAMRESSPWPGEPVAGRGLAVRVGRVVPARCC